HAGGVRGTPGGAPMNREQELASRHCQACKPGTPTISEDKASEYEAQLDPSWVREDTLRLRRELEVRNFRDAFGFVAPLALLAEAGGPHPDIELGWGRVAVTLTTHAAGGLTDNDFILAAKLDRLWARSGGGAAEGRPG